MSLRAHEADVIITLLDTITTRILGINQKHIEIATHINYVKDLIIIIDTYSYKNNANSALVNLSL